MRYLSSKDKFIHYQQRITMWGLKLWQANCMSLCKSPKNECEGELIYTEKKEVRQVIANSEHMAFHRLSLCQERKVFSFAFWAVLSQSVKAPRY